MPDLYRIRAIWTGATGLPGITQWYTAADGTSGTISNARNAIGAFYAAVESHRPAGVVVTLETSGDIIDGTTGEIINSWTDSTGRTSLGTGAGTFAGGVGAFVRARTGAIFNGRRVRGGFYEAPLVSSAFDSDGTLSAATVEDYATALGTLHGALGVQFYVSAAARKADPSTGRPASAYHQAQITQWQIVDRATQLKSRRT